MLPEFKQVLEGSALFTGISGPFFHTTTSLTKGLCMTGQQRDWSSERDCGLGERNSRAAQPEQACDITKPFPADPWPPGPLDRRGAQRRPILHYSWPKTFNPFTDKGWTPDQTWHLRGFMYSSFKKLIFAFPYKNNKIVRAELSTSQVLFVFLEIF